ncbi:MAG: SCO family protein [Pseudomonadota bacterium]
MVLVFALGALTQAARAGGFVTEAPPPLVFAQHLGAQLPLELPLRDADGRTVRLGAFFVPGRPVVLVPGYYRCPNLCGTLMQGVLESLADTGLPRSAYTVVGFSIDPAETPADASARQAGDRGYAAAYGSRTVPSGMLPPVDLHLLLGSDASTAMLADAIGFGYRRAGAGSDAAGATTDYQHAAGFLVVTPQGVVSRYLMGVRFEPRDLRLALVEASSGRVGTLSDRIALLCAHFDPATGRYSTAVMAAFRIGGVLLALGLTGWILRHRRGAVAARRIA